MEWWLKWNLILQIKQGLMKHNFKLNKLEEDIRKVEGGNNEEIGIQLEVVRWVHNNRVIIK